MQAIERNIDEVNKSPSLYSMTGDIKHVNTMMVNRHALSEVLAHIDALTAENERLRKDAERMKEGLDAVEALIDNSSGVAGLHQNGDVASWSELRTGGHFEAWLLAFDEAIDAAMKGTP